MVNEKEPMSPGAALAAQRKIVEKQCAYCGKTMTGTIRKKYCDDTCKQAQRAERQKAQRRLNRENKVK